MSFRHEAMLYAGDDELVARIEPFLREGVAAGEPVMVAVSDRKVRRLRERLGPAADEVLFADMDRTGMNPGRIIHAWHEFAAPHLAAGRPVRGVGEPVSASRSADELVECQRHEELLNLAFGSGPAWTLLCPYDTTTLDPAVIAECRCSHPHVREGDVSRMSADFRGVDAMAAPFAAPLPEPQVEPEELAFDVSGLARLRRRVAGLASAAGLDGPRCDDLVVAVHELAANSVRHGGGAGVLRAWRTAAGVTCEIRDSGFISEPLAGRLRPALAASGGHGMWLAYQLTDLLQVRSSPDGTTVRLLVRVA